MRFHTRTRSANTKTYSCGILVKGTRKGDTSGVDYYGVLEEVLRVEYLSELIKRCYYSVVIGSTPQTLGVRNTRD